MPLDVERDNEAIAALPEISDEDDALDDEGSDEETEFDLGDAAEVSAPASRDRVKINGGDGLTLSEANAVVGAVPSTVVLLAGEANAGKTTLLVELFAQFLGGPVGDWKYAGSKTLSGFHRRHKTARASSGSATPATERTQDDDIRHLHLAVASESRRVDLIVSDIRGEIFESIVDGGAAGDELTFLARVDVCLVLVDGELMGRASTRTLQLLRAKQLLMGLLAPDGLGAEAAVMIVATKADTLTPELRDTVTAELEKMATTIHRRPIPVSAHVLSARPADQTSPLGLVEVFELLVSDRERRSPTGPQDTPSAARFFWNGSRP